MSISVTKSSEHLDVGETSSISQDSKIPVRFSGRAWETLVVSLDRICHQSSPTHLPQVQMSKFISTFQANILYHIGKYP